jgi:hypothetical protein
VSPDFATLSLRSTPQERDLSTTTNDFPAMA